MTERLLGGFEHMVLLGVLQLEGTDAYALPIRRKIEERTGRAVSRGALYTVLERLERKGYLASQMGEATEIRGGRPKRNYTVTQLGVSALILSKKTLVDLWQGLDSVLG